MNAEQASFFGLIGSGLSIAAFCGLTLIGIMFVQVLDIVEGHFTRLAGRLATTDGVMPISEYDGSEPPNLADGASAPVGVGLGGREG
jgi:hypothetical protein